MTEWLHFHFSLSCIGEGNGNPLQCSCLENPRDGGAWWAAVYGVAQTRTWLKRFSSSSSSKTVQLVLISFVWIAVSSSMERLYHLKSIQLIAVRGKGGSLIATRATESIMVMHGVMVRVMQYAYIPSNLRACKNGESSHTALHKLMKLLRIGKQNQKIL